MDEGRIIAVETPNFLSLRPRSHRLYSMHSIAEYFDVLSTRYSYLLLQATNGVAAMNCGGALGALVGALSPSFLHPALIRCDSARWTLHLPLTEASAASWSYISLYLLLMLLVPMLAEYEQICKARSRTAGASFKFRAASITTCTQDMPFLRKLAAEHEMPF